MSIAASADTLNEADRTLVLTLTGVTDGGNAAMFPGGTAAVGSVTVALPDDDDITYEITANASILTEGDPGGTAGSMNFSVSLSHLSRAAITLPYRITALSGATAGVDYAVPSPMTVTIPAGMARARARIAIIPDNLNESSSEGILVELCRSSETAAAA